MKTLIGCCLIHLVIGSIYAVSVLYPQISQLTGWDTNVMITGFSLTILALGLTAAFHQRIFRYMPSRLVLQMGLVLWLLSIAIIITNVGEIHNIMLYYLFSIIWGMSIGILYVVPLNIIANYGYKRLGLASGLVVSCFGLGSLIAAYLFSQVDLKSVEYGILAYGIILACGILLIDKSQKIMSSESFVRDVKWWYLAALFFLNIGIGISLLSNLTPIFLEKGFTLVDAAFLVSLAGIANALGRLVYATISDFVGKFNTLFGILCLQAIMLIVMALQPDWTVEIIVIISVYGGVFALMPGLLKELYGTTTAYSQILSMWGFSGLICPIMFQFGGVHSLLILSGLLWFFFTKSHNLHKSNLSEYGWKSL